MQMVVLLEQNLNLKSVGFEDVTGRLKAYEERDEEEHVSSGNINKLLYANYGAGSSYARSQESTRGPGRSNRGMGSGRFSGGQDRNTDISQY